MKKDLIKFIFLFIFLFLVIFIGSNFESFQQNFKYRLSKILPGKIEIIGEAAKVSYKEEILYQPDTIFIQKIDVQAPILRPKSEKEKDILLALKEGVALHPSSSLPSQKGITIIQGHSSPHLYPLYRGKYNTVFTFLDRLERGDEIILYFNNNKYIYQVINKYIFLPQEELPEQKEKSILFLVTCWPRGTDLKRMAIEAELKKE